jgi:hypothetical protein
MPFVYVSDGAVNTANFVTGGANTPQDYFFIKPGTRNVGMLSLIVGGKGAGLVALSGIAYHLEKYPTTSTAINTGTALVPAPSDVGMQAAKATAASSTGAQFTAGTGTKVFVGGCFSGAAGPGGWVAENPDALPMLEGSANQSIDLWVESGTASLNFNFVIKHQE